MSLCLALRCGGGVLLISPLRRYCLIVRDLWLIEGGIFYRSFVINLKIVRCELRNSGLLLMKVKLLNFLMRKGVLPSCWRMKSCIGSSGLRLFCWRKVTLIPNVFMHKLRVVRLPIRLVLLLMIMV